jgi:hypothetical protein
MTPAPVGGGVGVGVGVPLGVPVGVGVGVAVGVGVGVGEADVPARSLIKLIPFGVPKPVQRS